MPHEVENGTGGRWNNLVTVVLMNVDLQATTGSQSEEFGNSNVDGVGLVSNDGKSAGRIGKRLRECFGKSL